MKHITSLAIAAGLALAASPLAAQEEAQDELPTLDPNAALVNVTCADFNTAAAIAVPEEGADEARMELAKAAQDDIAYGLTWMHGYFYAYQREKMPKLNEAWLKETAEALAKKCGSVANPEMVKIIDLGSTQ